MSQNQSLYTKTAEEMNFNATAVSKNSVRNSKINSQIPLTRGGGQKNFL